MNKKSWTYMDGTEGTGEYKVIARTGRGKVGIRHLGGMYRIRIEPFGARFVPKMAEHMPSGVDGWKQPGDGGQNRFSKFVRKAALKEHVKTALAAIGYNVLVSKTNTEAPEWASALLPA